MTAGMGDKRQRPEFAWVSDLGRQPYVPVWQAMRRLTDERDHTWKDEVWIVEHLPVYTQGQAGQAKHLFAPGQIPCVSVDRGGQVTYHGPGQLVVYPLLDLRRLNLGIRDYVARLEELVIASLAHWQIGGERRLGAPGVYVGQAKIAALGIRVRHGRCYHGVAINVAMDLSPFTGIDPCGYPGLAVTSLAELQCPASLAMVRDVLLAQFMRIFQLELRPRLTHPLTTNLLHHEEPR